MVKMSKQAVEGRKTLGQKLQSKIKAKESLWKGPQSSHEQGGVTQSLLSKFLVCRERFRLLVVEGLRAEDYFQPRIEYGNMWHACEEEWARSGGSLDDTLRALKQYCSSLVQQYQGQQDQVEHWYKVCRVQFPIYLEHWKRHKHVKNGTPLLQEEEFKVPYVLPSRRIVWLRGKWDAVDLVGSVRQGKIWLQENKSKAEIDKIALNRQLSFDLQSMFYLVALYKCFEYAEQGFNYSIKDTILPDDAHWGNLNYGPLTRRPVGVRYNVIRRPLSGGLGTIKKKKPTKSNPEGETSAEFYARLDQVIRDLTKEDPESFFARWEVEVSAPDIRRFEQRTLIPLLESLCSWWDFMEHCQYDPWNNDIMQDHHWQHPFGIYNVLNEGGYSDVDAYIESGSTVGLRHVEDLFPELG